jgi:methionyl-tRNA formyltransferase
MRLVFIGTGDIGLPVLRSLLSSREHELVGVVTQPDKPVGRAQIVEAPPIKSALASTAVPVLQPERIKRQESVAAIRSFTPDVIVVMAYGQIVPRSLLDTPRLACLNLHASLLPRHRGAAPIQAAILVGDRESGISVMYMDEGIDTGDILLQVRLEITPAETGGSLHDRLGAIAPEALQKALSQLERGTAPRLPQDSSAATYARKLGREDGRINWNDPAVLIERRIRAFDPWPGTFAVVRDPAGHTRNLKVFGASVIPSPTQTAGNVFRSNDSIAVTTSDGALELHEVQLEGKRRMSGAEFLRGHEGIMATAFLSS